MCAEPNVIQAGGSMVLKVTRIQVGSLEAVLQLLGGIIWQCGDSSGRGGTEAGCMQGSEARTCDQIG